MLVTELLKLFLEKCKLALYCLYMYLDTTKCGQNLNQNSR